MINRAVVSGRLTKDIELKKANNNASVTQFTLACEGYNKHTDFITFVAWRQSAEYLSKYAHKGDMVMAEGRIQTRSYDGQNGKVYVTEIVADNVQLCSSKKQDNVEEQKQESYEWEHKSNNPSINGEQIDPDDLPFY